MLITIIEYIVAAMGIAALIYAAVASVKCSNDRDNALLCMFLGSALTILAIMVTAHIMGLLCL